MYCWIEDLAEPSPGSGEEGKPSEFSLSEASEPSLTRGKAGNPEWEWKRGGGVDDGSGVRERVGFEGVSESVVRKVLMLSEGGGERRGVVELECGVRAEKEDCGLSSIDVDSGGVRAASGRGDSGWGV